MDIISVDMLRDNLRDLPKLHIPQGFSCRLFGRGDESLWIDLMTVSGLFASSDLARERFENEFSSRIDELEERCYFLIDDSNGCVVASAIAWLDPNYEGQNYGRVHWVGVHPDYRGRGLGRAIVVKALHRLAELHDRATLRTQTIRIPAIRLYLSLGFVPNMNRDRAEEAWQMISREIAGRE